MTLLIISPDYASHLYPLATLGTQWQKEGHDIFVATGHATAHIVEDFGYTHIPLQLGRGSNPGVIRSEEQPEGEDQALRRFFEATHRGMVETLTYQATARMNDFMWEPVKAAHAVQRIVKEIDPDYVVVDHLAFSARVGLNAMQQDYYDVVLGHPSALPLPENGEVYGVPVAWPAAMTPSDHEMRDLRDLCASVSQAFTRQWNETLLALNPAALPVADAFAEHGPALVFNYPRQLVSTERQTILPKNHIFMGSLVRPEAADPEITAWIESSDQPYVYVSFGSFLSIRGDVLTKVVDALKLLGVRAAIALGSSDADSFDQIPDKWLVREFLPQVSLLQSAAGAVTHGGNNSLTEALTFGVPTLVLPFSTDQFDGAAAIEKKNLGASLDPNRTTVEELASSIQTILNLPAAARESLREISLDLQQEHDNENLRGLLKDPAVTALNEPMLSST